MSARWKSLVAVLACLAVAGAACGDDESEPTKPQQLPAAETRADDEAAIKTAIESYLAALAEGDGERACAAMTADLQDQVVAQAKQLVEGGGCEAAIARLGYLLSAEDKARLASAAITKVSVQGDAATASGAGESDVQLVREGGVWRISALAFPTQPGGEKTRATLPSDGCSLLSREQVAEILGSRATSNADAGEIRSDARYVQCIWETKKGGVVDEKLTVVLVDSPERYAEIAEDPDAEPVEDVGDAAVAFTGGPPFGLAEDDDFGPSAVNTDRVIVVRAGKRTLLIELNPITVRDRSDLERRVSNRRLAAIAREVLEGL